MHRTIQSGIDCVLSSGFDRLSIGGARGPFVVHARERDNIQFLVLIELPVHNAYAVIEYLEQNFLQQLF